MATKHHISTPGRHLAVLVLAVLAAFVLSAPSHAAYGWPVKPFQRQHPVRGLFGDPRIGLDASGRTARQFHFGVDVSAPNGTPVYATISGTVVFIHPDALAVRSAGGVEFSYWHIVPRVRAGTYVTAYRTVIGRIEKPWAHVHFSEARYGRYLNPLRAGALTPYADHAAPVIKGVEAQVGGRAVAMHAARRTIDLAVEAFDAPPVDVPPPWQGLPVMPAVVRWRLVGASGPVRPWTVAADFRLTIPGPERFFDVFDHRTRQNHAHRPGRYRIYLTHGFRTDALRDGRYRLEVVASDIRGNRSRLVTGLDIVNHGPLPSLRR